VRTVGDEGATGEIPKTVESVKIVSVYLSFQNNKIKLMGAIKVVPTLNIQGVS
jgi:ribosomal protein S25